MRRLPFLFTVVYRFVFRLFPYAGLPVLLGGLVLDFPAFAQGNLTGRVVTPLGTGVPFVVVRNEENGQAVLSDIDGYFTWPCKQFEFTVDHPDFLPKQYSSGTTPTPSDTLFFYLAEEKKQGQNLSSIATGSAFIRKLLERKDDYSPANYSFHYSAYHKLTVSATRLQEPGILRKLAGRFFRLFREFSHYTPHLFMMESVTERTHIPGKADHENILGTNATGVSNTSLLTPATTLQPFNIFSDYFEVPSFRFVSPLARNTLKRYRFSLVDSVQIDGSWIYRVQFKPKPRRNFDGVEGVLYLNAKTLAPVAVSGRESRITALPLLFAQSFQQSPQGPVFPWVMRIKFELVTASKSRTAYIAELTSYIQDLSIPKPPAKPLFDPVILSSRMAYDTEDTTYWRRFRGNTFTPHDRQTYVMFDSLGVRKKLSRSVLFAEKVSDGLVPLFLFDVNLYRLLRYNEHEGLRPGLELVTNHRFSRHFRIGMYGGYGLNDQEWKYTLQGGLRLHSTTDTWLSVSTNKLVEESGLPDFMFPVQQFSSEWLRNLRVRKMDQIRSQAVQLQGRPFRDIKLQVQFAQIRRKSLFDYTFVPHPDQEFQLSEVSSGARFAFRERFVETPNQRHSAGSKYPILSIQIRKGLKGVADGEIDYWKADSKLAYRVRSLSLGISSFQVIGGFVNGKVPYGLLFNGKGSLRIPSVVIHNSFETMRYNEFLSDRYAALFFSHQFGKLLVRLKGFEPSFELLHNMGIGSLRNPQDHLGLDVKQMKRGYFESGFFINDLIAFRVYLVKSSLGSGFMFRYGPYAFHGFKQNAYFKLSLGIGI